MEKAFKYLLGIVAFLVCTYILVTWLMPLFFSCLIVLILQPLLAKEISLLKIKNNLLGKLVIVLNYLLFIVITILIIIFCVVQIYRWLDLLPSYLFWLYQLFSNNHYVLDLGKYLDFIYSGSMSAVESISSSFIHGLLEVIMKIPSIFFDGIFIVMMSLFMLLDYQRIDKLIIKKYRFIATVIEAIKDVFSNMFKAYTIIMIVTFFELWIGFVILNLNYSMMLACIIAIFDFMPILGLDMIMIPWIVVCAFTNNMANAIGLLIIYMVVIITKNILEPKLIARGLGITPLVSLIGMYLGMKIFGIVGLIIIPVLLVIVMQIIKVKNYQVLNEK